jgi:tetratricopeptide (TPR) repeat protein
MIYGGNMVKTMIVVATLLFTSLSAHSEDMMNYLLETWELSKQGSHQEALDRCIWFHNHALEHERAMNVGRLSYNLNLWKDLGESYPPALVVLKKIRDDNTALLEAGKGSYDLFKDVAAINRVLGENNRTVELFRKLDKKQSDLAKRCWMIVKDSVIESEAYDLVRKYLPDPVMEYYKVKRAYDQYASTLMTGDPALEEPLKADNEGFFVGETVQLINVAIALDDMKAAKEIQKKALTVLDDSRLKEAIPAEEIIQDTQALEPALSTQAEDMHDYLRESWTLAKEGKHQEALERYIWFHNHALEHDRGMHGVRLSFALGAWKNLGESYPPALVALKKIRDDDTALLEAGKGRFDLFVDVAAINRTLGENSRTVELFRRLDKEQSALAKRCWMIADDVVIEAEAYDLVQKYLTDPVRKYNEIEWQYENSKLTQTITLE